MIEAMFEAHCPLQEHARLNSKTGTFISPQSERAQQLIPEGSNTEGWQILADYESNAFIVFLAQNFTQNIFWVLDIDEEDNVSLHPHWKCLFSKNWSPPLEVIHLGRTPRLLQRDSTDGLMVAAIQNITVTQTYKDEIYHLKEEAVHARQAFSCALCKESERLEYVRVNRESIDQQSIWTSAAESARWEEERAEYFAAHSILLHDKKLSKEVARRMLERIDQAVKILFFRNTFK